MDHVADIGAQDHQRQRAQDLDALGGHHPGHISEHADGAQADDEGHQPLDDSVEGGDNIPAQLCLLTSGQNGAAEEQGNDNDLQHVGLREGHPHVGGENAHQHAHEAAEFAGLIGDALGGEGGKESCAVEEVGQDQTDHAGNGGGAHEVDNGLPGNRAYFPHITHRDDAVDHGEQHHGNYDELQQVDENITKRLQVIGGEVS